MAKGSSRSKPVGKIGPVLISRDGTGRSSHAYQEVDIGSSKEEIEGFFGHSFVNKFNATKPLGEDITIEITQQNDTSNRDFSINCQMATYLELAEFTPVSEKWGKETLSSGKFDIYTASKWIWQNIIFNKETKYKNRDIKCSEIILLIYVTHPQFNISDSLVECLKSTLKKNGCDFSAVFLYQTNGSGFEIIYTIYPVPPGMALRAPRHFRGLPLINIGYAGIFGS